MSRKKIILISFGVLILGFLLICIISIMRPTWTGDSEELVFTINRGESVISIANDLKNQEVFVSQYPFLGYLVLTNNIENVQAGTYKLSSDMNVLDLTSKLTNGHTEHKTITVIEGWNLREIAKYFEAKNITEKEKLLSLTGISKPQADLIGVEVRDKNFDKEYKVLEDLPTDATLEGYLFPDTYRVSSENPEEIIEVMIKNLENRMEKRGFFEQIEEKDINIHETIIMASLIEKEVSEFEDRRMVSDILWRRLETGIPLQIDATVNYITGRKGINVTTTETKVNSPFNTYQITGLPQGPIANPSIESIEAVLNPKENNFWYYLSNPETGETVFSKNHLEHINAKNKYLR
ncbi:MAG: endolytic transglycosylase MltG [Patescibacteria group bacterium]